MTLQVFRKMRRRRWGLPLMMTFLVLLSIGSIWQSSEVNLSHPSEDEAISGALMIMNDGVENFPAETHTAKNNPQPFPPRVFFLHAPSFQVQSGRIIEYPMTAIENIEQASRTEEPIYKEFEREWLTECQPVKDIPVRSTCNSFHELGAMEGSTPVSLLSMEGSWRSVWKVMEEVSDERLILKLLHLHRNFTVDAARAHQVDSRVMEQLTASPRVVSSYGFCGQSVLTQFAQSSGSAVIKDSTLKWRDRLIMAVELAQGLAELHSLQPMDWERNIQKALQQKDSLAFLQTVTLTKPLIFAHNDINVANTVSLAPKLVQWNDFNLGMLSQNRTDGSGACPVPVGYEGIMWRSPEEIQNYLGHVDTLHPSDVYAFGALLYTVFTKHQPWTHLEERDENPPEEEIAQNKLQGVLPKLPPKYQPQRLEAKVLWEATKACFRRDPAQRPTAYRLGMALGVALKWIQSRKELTDDMIQKLFAP